MSDVDRDPAVEPEAEPRATGEDAPADVTQLGLGGSPSPPPERPALEGDHLGHYRIEDVLGQGAMGIVYRAFDQRLKRRVALKVLRIGSQIATERLLAEATAQAQVDHEHICKVYEAGILDGEPFIAMQYIEGRTLRQAYAEMTLREKVEVIRQVAEAIHAAHRRGLVHRDVKPGNILVDRSTLGRWRPHVLDFGLAREVTGPGETMTGEIKGTPTYMAPEQVTAGAELDARADVYSLGATLYEVVAGRPLFDGAGMAVLVHVVNEEPDSLRSRDRTVPVDLDAIVMKCLEKDPARRYATAQDLAEDLGRFLEGEPVSSRTSNISQYLRHRIRKNRVRLLKAALVVTLLFFAGLFLRSEWRLRRHGEAMDRYRQEVRFVDDFLRHAYEAPLHDVTAEKEEIRDRLERIQAAAAEEGRFTRGPAHYAIGRIYLTLQDHDRAREHLELAWQSGTREAEVAYALGRTLGAIYERELRALQRVEDEEERQARRQMLEHLYRESALDFLRRGRAVAADSIDLVEALLDFWEEGYDSALQKAQKAYREVPWLYPARILEGDVYVAQGAASYHHGEYEEALALYDEARTAYAEAAEQGRSDARVYVAQCNLARVRMELLSYGLQRPLSASYAAGREACARARRVDPSLLEPVLLESVLHWRMGESEILQGRDPTATLERAAEVAAAAIRLAPENVEAPTSMGWAHSLLAQWQIDHGKDPSGNAIRAIAGFQRATELDDELSQGWNGLGYTRSQLARYQIGQGKDPGVNLRAATAALERAVEIRGDYLYALDNLANTWIQRGRWQRLQGEDPLESYEAAHRYIARMREINPNYVWMYTAIVDAVDNLARYRLDRGEDAGDLIAEGRRALDEAAAIDPGDPWVELAHGLVDYLEARAAVARGEEAGKLLDEAAAHLNAVRKRMPESVVQRLEADLKALRSVSAG